MIDRRPIFADRRRKLAVALKDQVDQDPVVLALPRATAREGRADQPWETNL
jgi:hypothetical protein